ncbi:ATP-binding cassette domain-containing protein [Ancylobacter dichloromethanicus]|uniref:ABC transporter ATP-binding protein n=1 Tax=Ancylobacter dichloromethanicus TaxID=518825 RepID=A0A9W6JAI4_9HYPH|nr:ABC transporter ATP-binding protein [Ancylobacter dichloromethanicus]MBS7555196.1 ATP-binding cassette domain-containing protein [Ancylobacter dichloromethanicus]GLK73697.1 ABC transporter ATP-binding protein [Ancylobacter dichloromethanicus]
MTARPRDLPSAPGAGVPALAVSGVSHAFGVRKALDDVSLDVPAGSFTALLGPNGAGKTTLFSLVTRLYDNRSGAIHVLGSDVRRQPAAALSRLGVVFQARTLDLELTVLDNLLYHATLHGIGFRAGRHRALELLAQDGIADRASDKVRNLSGGQMRRVEIVRALMHRPRLLLLDEPTVGLDIASRAALVAQVRALVAQEGIGVLWATHIIEEIGPGDRVVVLHRGRVRAEGSYEELLARSGGEDLSAAFLQLVDDAGEAAA